MNSGKIMISGSAGDVLGYAMRGGKIFVKGDVGYRVGIHMKSFKEARPLIIIGGSAGDFLGEYMAGGTIVLLNMDKSFDGDYIGAGMHGGSIFIRGEIDKAKIGDGVGVAEVNESEMQEILPMIREFSVDLGVDHKDILAEKFYRLYPLSARPYGMVYSY
jgi:glutamate synthase domain-containing protein 3